MISTGQQVSIRGEQYRVVHIKNCSSLGSKFFGKFVFTVANAQGEQFTAFGKTLAGNSKLTPVSEG